MYGCASDECLSERERESNMRTSLFWRVCITFNFLVHFSYRSIHFYFIITLYDSMVGQRWFRSNEFIKIAMLIFNIEWCTKLICLCINQNAYTSCSSRTSENYTLHRLIAYHSGILRSACKHPSIIEYIPPIITNYWTSMNTLHRIKVL